MKRNSSSRVVVPRVASGQPGRGPTEVPVMPAGPAMRESTNRPNDMPETWATSRSTRTQGRSSPGSTSVPGAARRGTLAAPSSRASSVSPVLGPRPAESVRRLATVREANEVPAVSGILRSSRSSQSSFSPSTSRPTATVASNRRPAPRGRQAVSPNSLSISGFPAWTTRNRPWNPSLAPIRSRSDLRATSQSSRRSTFVSAAGGGAWEHAIDDSSTPVSQMRRTVPPRMDRRNTARRASVPARTVASRDGLAANSPPA